MERLKRLLLDASPVASYFIALLQYYVLSMLFELLIKHNFILDSILTILIIPYICAIAYTGKLLMNYFLNYSKYQKHNKIKLCFRIMLSPYINPVNFFKYISTFDKHMRLAIRETDSVVQNEHINNMWEHLEKPFKRSKDLL